MKHENKNLECCTDSKSYFRAPVAHKQRKRKACVVLPEAKCKLSGVTDFPPRPPRDELKRRIIRDFCNDLSAVNMIEAGCAVCGCLSRKADMEDLTEDLFDHNLLEDPTSRMTRRERRSAKDKIQELQGPIMDKSCTKVCVPCLTDLRRD
ncbi:hypothetical protein PENSPDRAFT_594244 [Peniophora sp. CONT]|nr:hypothetical protein PENSPDRAFT_594244 [Peniophora sp. CONT]